jgi:nucleoside-diphosphate-sugar epimerase
MRVLITGNMGYVGSTLVPYLRSKYPKYTIKGLDVGYFAGLISGTNFLPETSCNIQYYIDVRDITDEILRNVDSIVHLAAVSNDPIGVEFEEATREINELATVKLADRAKSLGVKRFVFASSCSVYGAGGSASKKEEDSVEPLTAYAKSKVAAEKRLYELKSSEMQITCLRFATACGMSDRLRLDLVLNDFAAAAYLTSKLEILSDGTPWRPLIDVSDMARAIDWALHRKQTPRNDYVVVNAGSNEANYRVADLAKAVTQLLPNTTVLNNPNAKSDPRSYRVNFDLYRKLAPDFLPITTLEESISRITHGLRRIASLDSDFRKSNFIRLNWLRRLIAENKITHLLRRPS